MRPFKIKTNYIKNNKNIFIRTQGTTTTDSER